MRLINNSNVTVRMDPTSTVRELMEEVEKIEGIKANQQRLIHAGKVMDPAKTLSDYKVSTTSVIHMVLRLVGGK